MTLESTSFEDAIRVLAFYVLHGLSSGLRQKIYAEASRLSRGRILFYDYNQKRRLLTDIAEWAEGGDYFEFVRHGADEMKAFFSRVEVIDAGIQTAFYLCDDDVYLESIRNSGNGFDLGI